jgi:hypothetical protein
MTGAGFVKDITTRTFTLSADFQVQPSEGASWKTTGEIATIQISW